MKKGDLVRIIVEVVSFDDNNQIVKTNKTIKAIEVRDYTGDKLVKVFVPSTGEVKKFHASQVQLHKKCK